MALNIELKHARLDVKAGRDDLKKVINAGKTVSITAQIEIVEVYGDDDGESQEFEAVIKEFNINQGGT
jgi:hypothetical protein